MDIANVGPALLQKSVDGQWRTGNTGMPFNANAVVRVRRLRHETWQFWKGIPNWGPGLPGIRVSRNLHTHLFDAAVLLFEAVPASHARREEELAAVGDGAIEGGGIRRHE